MSDYSEMYQSLKEEAKAAKKEAHDWSMKIINDLSPLFDITVQVIQEWHLRLWFPKGRLDYYTQSGKSNWLGTNKWFHISDLEQFIRQQYPDHPENKKQ